MPIPTYKVAVDWNNGGAYALTGSDVSARARGAAGMRIHRGRDQARSVSPPVAAQLEAELDNQSGDYSTENSGSPLNGYLFPGHLTKVEAGYGTNTYDQAGVQYNTPGLPYDGKTYGLFTGYLDDLTQKPDREKRSAGIPALGGLSRLVGKTVSTPLYQNITTDVALGYLLDAVGWPTAARRLSLGGTTLVQWWLDNEDAFAAASVLLACEGPGAALYDNTAGGISFEGANYRSATRRSTVAQSTIYSQGAVEPLLSPPFSYQPRQADIINIVTMTQKVRSAKTLGVAWSLGASLSFAASETKLIVARTSAGDPMTAAVTPVAATDFTVSAGSITAVSINRTSGGNIQITLTAGAGGATVTGLQLRAQIVSVDNTTNVTNDTTVTATATSITRYGRRAVTPPARSEMDLSTMQTLANAIVAAYQTPQPIISVRLVGSASDARLQACLRRQISDRITIAVGDSLNWTYNQAGKQFNQAGIPYDANYYAFNGDAYIESITHEVLAAQQIHVTTFGATKAAAVTSGLWGTGLWGTATWGF